jgi:hypothetical protein
MKVVIYNQNKNMKKLVTFIAIALTLTTSVFAQKDAKIKPVDQIQWSTTKHDFGNIKMGPPADIVFKFTNNTNAPIVITAADASCGCTTPTWTKTPVLPKESGEVKASYGTDGRPGYFQKSVKVTFDNGTVTDLEISGTVVTDTPKSTKAELN